MRNQLENIERAEKYVTNTLSNAEKEQFENELKTNSELVKLTEDLENFQSAVFRSEIRNKLDNNAGGTNGFKKSIIIGSILIALIGLGTLLVNKSPNTFSETLPRVTDSVVHEEACNLGGHSLWTAPDIQAFEFESEKGATIEGKDGTLIIVPTNAFVDSAGAIINGKVDFNLVEALGVEQMVLYKLNTVSNGSPLESGGMFYVDATVDGKPVQINPKRPLYIEIPTTNKKEGMMAFKGEVTPDGALNWVEPKPLKKFLVKVPLTDLDFLPTGFEAEVKSSMPFLTYKEASSTLTDSLYYSLNYDVAEPVSVPAKSMLVEMVKLDNGTYVEKPSLVDSIATTTIESTVNSTICGIEPTTIETIKTQKFANSFIATKEFEQRIKLLHKEDNGNALLTMYIKNLGKDMYQSDLMVAKATKGATKTEFDKLAAEKLTNIKDAEIYQERLSEYYAKKQAELKQGHKKLSDELARKTSKELNDEIKALNKQIVKQNAATNSITVSLPKPNVATAQTYATPWYSLGWGNIDSYLHLLSKGSVEKEIAVANMPVGIATDVTLWLGEINTYTNLSNVKGKYSAQFPVKSNVSNSKTHIFSIARSGDEYFWGMHHFNSYAETVIRFGMNKASIEEIKKDLQGVDMTFGRLPASDEWKRKEAERLVNNEIEARKIQAAWLAKRAAMLKKYNEMLRKQNERTVLIDKLRQIAFPCMANSEGAPLHYY
jgi:hypothetical protein